MRYDPKDADNLIPDGEYDGEIASAVEKTSKAGNDMTELKVKVWAGGGGPRLIFDYIVVPSSLYKLKQIAAATGQTPEFQAGRLGAADILGKSVRVAVKTQKGKDGFDDKNVITRYLPQEAGSAPSHEKSVPDEDIPF